MTPQVPARKHNKLGEKFISVTQTSDKKNKDSEGLNDMQAAKLKLQGVLIRIASKKNTHIVNGYFCVSRSLNIKAVRRYCGLSFGKN